MVRTTPKIIQQHPEADDIVTVVTVCKESMALSILTTCTIFVSSEVILVTLKNRFKESFFFLASETRVYSWKVAGACSQSGCSWNPEQHLTEPRGFTEPSLRTPWPKSIAFTKFWHGITFTMLYTSLSWVKGKGCDADYHLICVIFRTKERVSPRTFV